MHEIAVNVEWICFHKEQGILTQNSVLFGQVFAPKLCKFLCKQFVLCFIVSRPMSERLANSSMAAIVGR